MEKIFAKDIREGERFTGYFIIRSKRLARAKTGNIFFVLYLADNTGLIRGYIWEQAEDIHEKVRLGDIVRIDCESRRFNGEMILDILEIRKAKASEVDLKDFPRIILTEAQKYRILRARHSPYGPRPWMCWPTTPVEPD